MSVLKIKKNGEWVHVGTGAEGKRGNEGNGIANVELVSGNHAPGTYDTYRITFTDGKTYDYRVYNGANGEGAGDMVAAIYDPQGKATDVFKYVDDAVGNIPTPDVSGQIEAHNVDTAAHNDVRLLITELTNRLNALANSDDTTLDQMAEVVAYIKDNRELIEQITTGKVSVSDIVDNLTTNVSNKPLSAAQGVALKALADAAASAAAAAQSKADAAATAAANAQTTANSKEASGTAASLINRTTAVNAADTNYSTLMARGTSLNSADTTPAVNGAIAWTYK